MLDRITMDPDVRGFAAGLVQAGGVTIGESPDSLRAWSTASLQPVHESGPAGGETRREAVRALLRAGGFKPSGRNKPAQEYLLRTLRAEGALPAILNVVDVINTVSLVHGLPISLIGADRLQAGAHFRYGREGERFVFNSAGQELDVQGLLCVCAGSPVKSQPVGSPVKDSSLAKVTTDDHEVLAVLYAPRDAVDTPSLQNAADFLRDAFVTHCGATSATTAILSCA